VIAIMLQRLLQKLEIAKSLSEMQIGITISKMESAHVATIGDPCQPTRHRDWKWSRICSTAEKTDRKFSILDMSFTIHNETLLDYRI